MRAKEEIIKKVMAMEHPENQRSENNISNDKTKFFGRLKRRYRLMIIFVVSLSLILIFMILPIIIAGFLQIL
jgi:hypothetical protein